MSNILDSNRPDRQSERSGTTVPKVDITVDAAVGDGIDRARVRAAAVAAARHRGFLEGKIGIRVTDNAAIRQCNRQFMDHDFATDVISFGYELSPPRLEGEMIVSAEMANQRAGEIGWTADLELLLYVVHGTLHITGMDDQEEGPRAQMRQAERDVLIELGVGEVIDFGVDAQPNSRPEPEEWS